MKDAQIIILIEQLACEVEREVDAEKDVARNCRLQDVFEHLRRAYHAADGSPCEFNDLLGGLHS